jgi:hypothetical protein
VSDHDVGICSNSQVVLLPYTAANSIRPRTIAQCTELCHQHSFIMARTRASSLGLTASTFLILFLSLLSLVSAQTYYCDADSPCENSACCGVSDGETQGVSRSFLPSACDSLTNMMMPRSVAMDQPIVEIPVSVIVALLLSVVATLPTRVQPVL